MVRSISLFGQILGEVSRGDFQTLVSRHGAEHNAKGFSSWTQLVAMLFSQLAQADSLRDIGNGLACCLGRLSHLGVEASPREPVLSFV